MSFLLLLDQTVSALANAFNCGSGWVVAHTSDNEIIQVLENGIWEQACVEAT